MISMSEECLASMLSTAHEEGWAKGHDMIPLEPELVYIAYHEIVEGLTSQEVRH